ncbi:MAG: hypothetical protein SGPRY_013921 [Prymnesium sp.]
MRLSSTAHPDLCNANVPNMRVIAELVSSSWMILQDIANINMNGNIRYVDTLSESSDRRVKRDIVDAELEDAYD